MENKTNKSPEKANAIKLNHIGDYPIDENDLDIDEMMKKENIEHGDIKDDYDRKLEEDAKKTRNN